MTRCCSYKFPRSCFSQGDQNNVDLPFFVNQIIRNNNMQSHHTAPVFKKHGPVAHPSSRNPRKKHGLSFPQLPAMGWGGWGLVTTALKDEMGDSNINSPATLSPGAGVKQTPEFQNRSFPLYT